MSKQIRIRAPRPWIAYPGSTVQQNYAEDLVHGFLLWDIEDRDRFDVRFVELPNPKPFITIEWKGSVEATVDEARKRPPGARFRIRNNDVLTQKEVMQLTTALRDELKVSEVTFKNDHQVDRDIVKTDTATLAKEDLRNPDVLLKLLKEYHKRGNVTEGEWLAVREQVNSYLQHALDVDDIVRNTKWSLRRLKFDNTFTYGVGNVINFDQINGIVGIFGPNRVGKSSIVGTIMYSLFNTTDRGNVKNLHVINVRQPWCYTEAIINVAGTDYVVQRQTVKHEPRNGAVHAGTALNVFRIDENGEAIDLAGEQRNDTEKVVRKLIGGAEDCLLTSVAAQDDVKLFINQGTSKRRKDLSRFLDLDIFDKMYEQGKNDVNLSKGSLRAYPDRDWVALEAGYRKQLEVADEAIRSKDHALHDASQRLQDLRAQSASYKDFNLVTKAQVEAQQSLASSLASQLQDTQAQMARLADTISAQRAKLARVEDATSAVDIVEMKRRLEAFKTLEASFESLKLVHEADAVKLKQQERSLKILDDVPCGDTFPGCRFIKDAFKNKEKVEPQREKVNRAMEKLTKAEGALVELRQEDLPRKVTQVEQLLDLKAKLLVSISGNQLEDHKLSSAKVSLEERLASASLRLAELEEALKNESNVEVITVRNSLDELQRTIRRLDAEKLALASEVGRVQSDLGKMEADRAARQGLLQTMKAHELIAQGFSRRGIPSLIVASQLPLINAEIAKILNGIVNFTVELEQDDDSDSMEVYIDYGDSKRIIELGSGMEKMIAAVAIRVALINVSSLPKTDMFIIDESFGSLDPSSVEACNRLLVSLKRCFKTIIVITHVEGVKDVADHIIEVTKVEKDARVTWNDAWPSARTSKTG